MHVFICVLALLSTDGAAVPASCFETQAAEIADAIAVEADEHGIPADLIAAVAYHESLMNPRARGSRGEVGLLQLHRRHFPGSVAKLSRIDVNVRLGAAHLGLMSRTCKGPPVYYLSRYNGRPCRPSSYSRGVLRDLRKGRAMLKVWRSLSGREES